MIIIVIVTVVKGTSPQRNPQKRIEPLKEPFRVPLMVRSLKGSFEDHHCLGFRWCGLVFFRSFFACVFFCAICALGWHGEGFVGICLEAFRVLVCRVLDLGDAFRLPAFTA